ncbi:hypothetical protein BJX66DRAFT_295419 [Aspergillus keveii]|uniref:Transmembrane protein n=1 Tax=Aspergillus keveii TaxID=714993 RepID=A0ABR4GH46_9EURO
MLRNSSKTGLERGTLVLGTGRRRLQDLCSVSPLPSFLFLIFFFLCFLSVFFPLSPFLLFCFLV